MWDPSVADHLDQVDIGDLQRKIHAFRRLSFQTLDRATVADELLNVLTFGPERRAVLVPHSACYPEGTDFYRVRRLSSNDRVLPLRSMRTVAHAWEPPASVVAQQRLNLPGESLLYTSPGHPSVAMAEAKVPPSTLFALIRYRSLAPINVTMIGADLRSDGLNQNQHLKLSMLMNFLEHEFTRDVGTGTEYLYVASEIIAKDYFDLPSDFQDGWCYPSVASKPAVNVAFRPAVAHAKLSLAGIAITKGLVTEDGYGLQGLAYSDGSEGPEGFQWYTHGTPLQQQVFPEFE